MEGRPARSSVELQDPRRRRRPYPRPSSREVNMVVDGTTMMAGGANLHGMGCHHGDGAPSPLPRNLPPSANRAPATMTRQRRRKPHRASEMLLHGLVDRLTGKNKKEWKEGKIRGMVVLLKSDMRNLGDFHASLLDGIHDILGKDDGLIFYLVSATAPDPSHPSPRSRRRDGSSWPSRALSTPLP